MNCFEACGCIFIALVLFTLLYLLIDWLTSRRRVRTVSAPDQSAGSVVKKEYITIPATVAKKRVVLHKEGLHIPQSTVLFLITFVDEKGNFMELSVSRAYFDLLLENQTGVLIYSGNHFIDFAEVTEL